MRIESVSEAMVAIRSWEALKKIDQHVCVIVSIDWKNGNSYIWTNDGCHDTCWHDDTANTKTADNQNDP